MQLALHEITPFAKAQDFWLSTMNYWHICQSNKAAY
jgi:hypothetical protein